MVDSMLSRLELELAVRLSRLISKWGLGEAVGKILAVLLLAGCPLSQQEIAKLTGYSVGLISTSLTFLESLGLVMMVEKIGRKKMYLATGSLIDVFENFIKEIINRQLSPTINFIKNNIPATEDRTKDSVKLVLREYENLRNLLRNNLRKLKKYKRS
ncbi:MAG: hypothetical protein DRJ49_03445 [Thermoprotei archaeon]|nr:MAG: hypothetical protein DRJ49_03445 [Thermoprotei archaeon]